MNNQDGIKKIIKLVFGVSIKVVSLLVGLYSMRWLNTNLNAGELKSFFISLFFTGSFLSISTLGMNNIVQRQIISKSQDLNKFNSLWVNSFVTQTIVSFIGIAVMVVISFYNPVLPLLPFLLIYIAQFFLAIDGNLKVIADFNNKTWSFTMTDLISKVLIVTALILYSTFNLKYDNIVIYGLIILFCAILQFALDLYFQRKSINWVKPNFNDLIQYKSEMIQFTIITLILTISNNSDRWFLSFYKFSDSVINGYVNVYSLYLNVTLLESFILPVLYYNMVKDKDMTKGFGNLNKKNKWLLLIFLMSFVSAIGFKIGTGFLLPIVDKESKYLNYSYEIVDILSLILLLNSSSFLMTQLIILKNKVKLETISTIIFTIVILISYIILIPKYGHIGAAYATLIACLSQFTVKLLMILKIKNEKYAN
jgi:O-antigen/teichoic acid export membrane protein